MSECYHPQSPLIGLRVLKIWWRSVGIWQDMPIFSICLTDTQISEVISEVTGPKFTIFYTRCSQIIAAVNSSIGVVIFQSVSECQGDEWWWEQANFADFAPKIDSLERSGNRVGSVNYDQVWTLKIQDRKMEDHAYYTRIYCLRIMYVTLHTKQHSKYTQCHVFILPSNNIIRLQFQCSMHIWPKNEKSLSCPFWPSALGCAKYCDEYVCLSVCLFT